MVNSKIKPIRTEKDYEAALARIDALMDEEPGSAGFDELDVLTDLAELYESKHEPMGYPSPVAAIKFRMEQRKLSPRDLIPFIGSRAKVSEVLSGKRAVTMPMARALHEHLGIPADMLLPTGTPHSSIAQRDMLGATWHRLSDAPGIGDAMPTADSARPVTRWIAEAIRRAGERARCVGAGLLLSLSLLATGCAVNPVTGQRELSLLSRADEIAIGQERYGPHQQMAGGQYQVDAGVAEYVASVGRRVAAFSDRHLPYEFVVVNDGTPNAWALPGGKIGVHRGLLVELESEAELAAVLGHEIVHAAAKHGANRIQLQMLFGLAGMGVALAVGDSKRARRIVGVTHLGLHMAGMKFGRDQERISDYHGMKYMHRAGYDTSAAATLQAKFVALSEGRRSDWLNGLFASHPPSPERAANNRAALAEFPAGGEVGGERYRSRMETLLEDRQAYDLADRALKNVGGSPARALRLIDQAIARQPRESLFHGIRGDILASEGKHGDAIRSYAAALERNPDYFGHYLGRGLSRDAIGDSRLARGDLARSNSLLPTPTASYKLGGYALAEGRRAEAKRLFKAASWTSGDVGTAARNAYARLDIEDAPWKYVKAEPFFEDGQVVVEVSNKSDYDVANIIVRVHVEINGESIYRRLRLNDLASGYYDVLESGIRYRGEDDVQAETRVLGAGPGW